MVVKRHGVARPVSGLHRRRMCALPEFRRVRCHVVDDARAARTSKLAQSRHLLELRFVVAERRLAVGGVNERLENVRLYVIDGDGDAPDTGTARSSDSGGHPRVDFWIETVSVMVSITIRLPMRLRIPLLKLAVRARRRQSPYARGGPVLYRPQPFGIGHGAGYAGRRSRRHSPDDERVHSMRPLPTLRQLRYLVAVADIATPDGPIQKLFVTSLFAFSLTISSRSFVRSR